MFGLCKYSDIFGKPGTGLHKYRIFNIAIVDLLLTILASYILSQIFHWKFYKVSIIMFLIGILAHKIFCVHTTISKFIFG